jgi:hypothetical protein
MSLVAFSRAALPQLLQQFQPLAAYATKAGAPKAGVKSTPAQSSITTTVDWKAVKIPQETLDSAPTTNSFGQAFGGDLRSTSGLSVGDGIKNHTDKWLQVSRKLARCTD